MSRHVRTCICFGDLWKRDPVVELINKGIFPKAQENLDKQFNRF